MVLMPEIGFVVAFEIFWCGLHILRQQKTGSVDILEEFLQLPLALVHELLTDVNIHVRVNAERERQKFCVHGIIGARQTGASNEHEHQTQFS